MLLQFFITLLINRLFLMSCGSLASNIVYYEIQFAVTANKAHTIRKTETAFSQKHTYSKYLGPVMG